MVKQTFFFSQSELLSVLVHIVHPDDKNNLLNGYVNIQSSDSKKIFVLNAASKNFHREKLLSFSSFRVVILMCSAKQIVVLLIFKSLFPFVYPEFA